MNFWKTHKELFENAIDLMIIDETHYGARAESYGRIIRTAGYTRDINMRFDDGEGDDYIETAEAAEQLKALQVKVKLHLSGTPYRILMGSEFSKEDIICFYQFSDIVKAQEEWEERRQLRELETGKREMEEWENPYYGFPQMIRFAFQPNASALELLNHLKGTGITYAFSELFKPVSISKKKDNSHRRFIHEKEVLELFEAMDGGKSDESIFPFLDYKKIQKGDMCRHMVVVLPYCASCDALENLLLTYKKQFKHLGQYEIINISGVDGSRKYKTVDQIKETIRRCERDKKKTITLTVNRMLTGSTVKEWDTMIFLKDTASPQEYDQAVFRLQSQYVDLYTNKEGEEIKYNMKPQTLLVDFDPHRMFVMQEQKSLIYNVNTDSSGNKHLRDRMETELEISPVITMNKGKIQQVEAVDILSAISDYSSSRGVIDEAKDIPVDRNLLAVEAIKREIERQAELGTKGGLKLEAYQGNKTDFEEPDDRGEDDLRQSPDTREISNSDNLKEADTQKEQRALDEKLRTYYSRILFFAFLTEDKVASLSEIIDCSSTEENRRILKNLALDPKVMEQILYNMDPFKLNCLDYKIENISRLSRDDDKSPIERAVTAMGRFGKLSESEVTTPLSAAKTAVGMLPDSCFKTLGRYNKILDIASKMGEFAIAIYERCMELNIDPKSIENSIESIPTSPVAYEFTRKVYRVLGLNPQCISSAFYAYDLLPAEREDEAARYKNVKVLLSRKEFLSHADLAETVLEREVDRVKFNAVVGNPPYQQEAETTGRKNGQNPRKNIFQHFVLQAAELSERDSVMIFPGLRWMHQSGKGLKDFGKELINSPRLERVIFYPNSGDIFNGIDIPDGISIVHLGSSADRDTFEYEYIAGETHTVAKRKKPGDDLFVVNPRDVAIIDKVKAFVEKNSLRFLHEAVLPRSLFGIESDFVDTYEGEMVLYDESMSIDYEKQTKVLTNDKSGPAGRSRWFVVDRKAVKKHRELIDQWQVVVSSAHPGGQDGRDNQMEIVDNHSAFGRARVALSSFKTRKEAENFMNYANSRFIKFAFLMSDESLTSLAMFVPDLIDYSDANGLLDFSADIDKQMEALLGLLPEESEYIYSILEKQKK